MVWPSGRTPAKLRGGFSQVNVTVTSISVFLGNAPDRSKLEAERETSCFQSPSFACFRRGSTPVSARRNAVASASTRSPSSATTGSEASTAEGNDSSATRAVSASRGAGPVRRLLLVQEDPRTGALEPADAELSELPAVERDFQKARATGETRAVQEVLVPAGDLEQQLPLARIPVERKKAVVPLEVPDAVRDRRGPVAGLGRGRLGNNRRRGSGQEQQHERQEFHRDLDSNRVSGRIS